MLLGAGLGGVGDVSISLKVLTGQSLFEVFSFIINVQVNFTFGSDSYPIFQYKSSVYNFPPSYLTFPHPDLSVEALICLFSLLCGLQLGSGVAKSGSNGKCPWEENGR